MNEQNAARKRYSGTGFLAAAVFAAAVGPLWYGWLVAPGLDSTPAAWAMGGLAAVGSLAGLVAVLGGMALALSHQLRLWPGVAIFGLGIIGGVIDAVAAAITFGAAVVWEMAGK